MSSKRTLAAVEFFGERSVKRAEGRLIAGKYGAAINR